MPADLDAAREVLAKISRAEQYIALHPGGADLLGMMEDRDVGYGYLGIESAAWLDEIEQLRAERDAAVRAVSEASTAQGRAEGQLAVSEMAGVLEGWIERCEQAEAERDRLKAIIEHDIIAE